MKIHRLKITNTQIFILALIAFVILKLPHLTLPFFWDEAWSYIPAIFKMYQEGPSLLPGQIDAWYSRGHPLLFYFLSAGWASVFGFSVLSLNIFALFISLLFFITVYWLGEKFMVKNVGLMASILLMSHHLIFIQSSFVLPEILLALLLLLTLVFYTEKKWMGYIAFGSLALLTKETAITYLPVVFLYEVIYFVQHRRRKKEEQITLKQFIQKMGILFSPLVPLGLFFILQKIIEGWYLYPEHTGFISLEPWEIKNKLRIIINFVFIQNKQWITLFILISSLIFIIIKKIYSVKLIEYSKVYILFLIFLTTFSIFNFFTLRYTIALFPLWYLLIAFFISQLPFKWLKLGLFLLIFFINTYATVTLKNQSDNTLGYVDAVNVSKQAVEFLEENDQYDKKICTTFLMLFNFKNPEVGYLSSNKTFNHVKNENCYENSDIYVITSWEGVSEYDKIKKNNKLMKRFQSGSAWVEIYYAEKDNHSLGA